MGNFYEKFLNDHILLVSNVLLYIIGHLVGYQSCYQKYVVDLTKDIKGLEIKNASLLE